MKIEEKPYSGLTHLFTVMSKKLQSLPLWQQVIVLVLGIWLAYKFAYNFLYFTFMVALSLLFILAVLTACLGIDIKLFETAKSLHQAVVSGIDSNETQESS